MVCWSSLFAELSTGLTCKSFGIDTVLQVCILPLDTDCLDSTCTAVMLAGVLVYAALAQHASTSIRVWVISLCLANWYSGATAGKTVHVVFSNHLVIPAAHDGRDK